MKDVRNVDGKVVGQIKDGVLMKRVFKKKHFMRVLNGWGLDLKILYEEGFDIVKILDKDEDICYVSKKEDWLNHGIKKNFGYGEQIILPVRWHEIKHRKQPELRIIT